MKELGTLIFAEMDKIQEPGHQLREKITEEGLEELSKSMARVGLENPIKLRNTPNGYEVVSGHRRYLAAKSLGWETIKAIVEDVSDKDTRLRAIHENFHREDMSPVEEAKAVESLLTDHEYSVAEVCKLCAKSPSWVASRLALLEMPAEIQEAVDVGAISVSAAKELAAITDDESRAYYTKYAISQGATAQLCAFWRGRWELDRIIHSAGDGQSVINPINPPPMEVTLKCILCDLETPVRAIEHLRVCPKCVQTVMQAKLLLITEDFREKSSQPQG